MRFGSTLAILVFGVALFVGALVFVRWTLAILHDLEGC